MTDISNRQASESLALEALSFLARDPDRISRFLANSGIDISQLREVAGEPGFLTAVLDHLLADEPLLLMFSEDSGLPPTDVPAARRALSGRSERI